MILHDHSDKSLTEQCFVIIHRVCDKRLIDIMKNLTANIFEPTFFFQCSKNFSYKLKWFFDIIWCDVIWSDVTWCVVVWWMWCNVMSCHAIPCHILSCHFIWFDGMWFAFIWFDLIWCVVNMISQLGILVRTFIDAFHLIICCVLICFFFSTASLFGFELCISNTAIFESKCTCLFLYGN